MKFQKRLAIELHASCHLFLLNINLKLDIHTKGKTYHGSRIHHFLSQKASREIFYIFQIFFPTKETYKTTPTPPKEREKQIADAHLTGEESCDISIQSS